MPRDDWNTYSAPARSCPASVPGGANLSIHSQCPPHLPRAVAPSPPGGRRPPHLLEQHPLTSQGSPPLHRADTPHLPRAGPPPPPKGSAPLSPQGSAPQCPPPLSGALPSPPPWGSKPLISRGSAPHLLGQTPPHLSRAVPPTPSQTGAPPPPLFPTLYLMFQHLCDLGPQTMSLEQADKACGGSPRCPRG